MTVKAEELAQNREFLQEVYDIHEQLLETIDYDKIDQINEKPEEMRAYLETEIQKLLSQHKPKTYVGQEERFLEALINEVIGFGPIEPLLHDPDVTDIFVNNPTTIFIEKKGKLQVAPIHFLNDAHVYRLVQRIASKTGRHLDLGTPYLDAQLPDGSRLHAIIPPVALDGVKLSIRKFLFKKLPIENLVDGGSLTKEMTQLLKYAVQARFNLVICGGTGSGKTTLLNTLLDSIRGGERVITIEDTPELEPTHGHIIRLLTRVANPEGKGAVSQEHLMINALRMRPDRVILGELRGSEAFNLLHAMNTGQDGSMATLHASGTKEVLARLLNMILMAEYGLSVESIQQQIAGALDLIVYIARLVDGSRKVMSISQVSQDKNGKIFVEDIFRYNIETINEHEVVGEFRQNHPKITERCRNKLISAGLIKEYEALFDGVKQVD